MKMWQGGIRGALWMGLIWGAAWLGAGLILLLFIGTDAADVPFPLGFGLLGFLAGVLFSVILGIGEGRRRLDQISHLRLAGWGALGGLLLAVIFALVTDLGGNLVVAGPVLAVAGAISAAGSRALAGRARKPE